MGHRALLRLGSSTPSSRNYRLQYSIRYDSFSGQDDPAVVLLARHFWRSLPSASYRDAVKVIIGAPLPFGGYNTITIATKLHILQQRRRRRRSILIDGAEEGDPPVLFVFFEVASAFALVRQWWHQRILVQKNLFLRCGGFVLGDRRAPLSSVHAAV